MSTMYGSSTPSVVAGLVHTSTFATSINLAYTLGVLEESKCYWLASRKSTAVAIAPRATILICFIIYCVLLYKSPMSNVTCGICRIVYIKHGEKLWDIVAQVCL
jgi:hypothetical protein